MRFTRRSLALAQQAAQLDLAALGRVRQPAPAASGLLLDHAVHQNNPTIRPSSLRSIELAAGTLGSPGMVIISPQIATTNSAPAESRTSRTGITCSKAAPL